MDIPWRTHASATSPSAANPGVTGFVVRTEDGGRRVVHPDLRIGLALYRYEHEGLSLAKAAALAGVSWAQMKEIMLERGIQPRLGPETLEEAKEEVEVLRRYLEGQE